MASRGLTIDGCNFAKNEVGGLVDDDVLDAELSPVLHEDGNLLASAALGEVEAQVASCRLDEEEACKPVLLGFDLAGRIVAVVGLLGQVMALVFRDRFGIISVIVQFEC